MTHRRLLAIALAVISIKAAAAAEDILIGQTADFSSVAGIQMRDFGAGAQAYFESVNARGGIGGRKIKLMSMDDGFTAAVAAKNAETLAGNPSVVALFATRGTDQTEAVIKVAERAKLPLIAPITGADSVRESAWTFPVRASYRTEMDGFLEQFGLVPTTLAVLVQDDKFGNPLWTYIQKQVHENPAYKNVTLAGAVKFDRKSTDLTAQVDQILALKPQAVIALCNPTSCGNFVGTLYKRTQMNKAARPIVAQTSISDMFAQYKTMGADALVGNPFGQVMPDPNRPQLAISRDFVAAAKAHNVPINYRAFEGYVSAAVLVEGLRKAKTLSRQGVKEGLESVGTVNLGGVSVDYAPGKHAGSSYFDVVSIDSYGRVLH